MSALVIANAAANLIKDILRIFYWKGVKAGTEKPGPDKLALDPDERFLYWENQLNVHVKYALSLGAEALPEIAKYLKLFLAFEPEILAELKKLFPGLGL